MNSTIGHETDKSTLDFPSGSPIEVTTLKSVNNPFFKTPYELSLTDERIAELHADKPIRVCNQAYYDALRDKPVECMNKTQERLQERLDAIKKYVADNPDSSSNQIADALDLRQVVVSRVCNDHPDVFIATRAFRTVIYRVK